MGTCQALYYELKPFGVRVAIVEPGRFDTPIREKILYTEGFDEQSPYWSGYTSWQEATKRLWPAEMANGSDPALAADIIFEAATTKTPRLRWLAGADMEAIAQMRRAAPTFEAFEVGVRQSLNWLG